MPIMKRCVSAWSPFSSKILSPSNIFAQKRRPSNLTPIHSADDREQDSWILASPIIVIDRILVVVNIILKGEVAASKAHLDLNLFITKRKLYIIESPLITFDIRCTSRGMGFWLYHLDVIWLIVGLRTCPLCYVGNLNPI